MHTVFIAKTNLNNDGRILNQIKILQNHYKDQLKIDFILLPDEESAINLGKNVTVHTIKPIFRNFSPLRLLTVFEFTVRAVLLLFKLKPRVLHVEDMTVVLPVYIYHLLKGKSFKLIYDDHEMPNENESLQYRIFTYFEIKLMKKADIVIFANKERMEYLKKQHGLKNKLTYFQNLPYFENMGIAVHDIKYKAALSDVQSMASSGIRFIIHQGSIGTERGRVKLAKFSTLLPHNIKLLILGISKNDFQNFIAEYQLNIKNFHFVGSVPYAVLDEFWKIASAAIVMYLPTYINNRLCAPNRFYIAIKNQLPILVNKDNPVLSNFIEEYQAGFFIEQINNTESLNQVINYKYTQGLMGKMIEAETKKFVEIYERI